MGQRAKGKELKAEGGFFEASEDETEEELEEDGSEEELEEEESGKKGKKSKDVIEETSEVIDETLEDESLISKEDFTHFVKILYTAGLDLTNIPSVATKVGFTDEKTSKIITEYYYEI